MTRPESVELLEGYSELLRYLAEKRQHGGPESRPGECRQAAGGCIRCRMVEKAERADREAFRLGQSEPIDDDGLVKALGL